MYRIFYSSALLGATVPILLDSALKGMVVLAAAIVVALLLRRSSASTRHLVLTSSLIGLLLLPLLSLALPQWRVLPSWVSPERTPEPGVTQPTTTHSPPLPLQPQTPAPSAVESPSPTPMVIAPDPPSAVESDETSTTSALPSSLLAIWALVASALLIRLFLSHILLGRLARHSTPLPDGPLHKLSEKLRHQLKIRREVTLLQGSGRSAPMTWGALRPRILLPIDAPEWSEDTATSVLLHELAHVKRWDSLSQLLLQIACALHWFNPLAWLVAKWIRREQEFACDDAALHQGTRASTYAQSLILIATGRTAVSAAVSMAGRSPIHHRVRAILDGDRNRHAQGWGRQTLCLLTVTVLLLPLSMLQVSADPAETPPKKEDPAAEQAPPKNAIDKLIEEKLKAQPVPLNPEERLSVLDWIRSSWDENTPEAVRDRALAEAGVLQKELAPEEKKRREKLIRRLYLDLLGLPPTPEVVEQLLKDPRYDLFLQRHLDGLLDEGADEAWARKWLDAARLAEDRKTRDLYRDWVLRAMKEDTASDEFLRKQLGPLADLPTGQNGGIGVRVKDTLTEGSLEIVAVLPNLPAAESKKITVGARILAVAQGTNQPLMEIAPLNHAQALALTRGAPESAVRLLLLPPGKTDRKDAITVDLKRVGMGTTTQKDWQELRSFFSKDPDKKAPQP